MTTTTPTRPSGSLEERRVPFNERVEIKFKLFQEFVSELSANLSLGGMFLKTRLPREPGTQFEFQIRLADDFALIEGTGEVAWRRAEDEGPERPAGMGVRFVTLSAESHKLIRRIVEEHERSGGRPFDLARAAPPEERPSPPAGSSATASGPTASRTPEPPPATLAPPVEIGSSVPAPPAPASRAAAASVPLAAPPSSRKPSPSPSGMASATAPPESGGAARRDGRRKATAASGRGDRKKQGGPATIEPAAPAAAPSPEAARPPASAPAAPTAPAVGRAAAATTRRGGWPASALRLGALALVSAAIGGLAVWLGHRILVQPQLDALARQVEELSHEARSRVEAARPPRGGEARGGAESGGAVAGATAPQVLPAARAGAAAASARDPAASDPIEAVRAWARAWSEKRFDDYLASYSRQFRPPDGLSRAAWEAQRRSRIQRPGSISVTVAAMEAEEVPGGVLVRCTQAYRSARYSDIVRKAILLAREEGAWRIVEERIER